MQYNHSLIREVAAFAALSVLLAMASSNVWAGEVRYVSDQIVLKMYSDSALSKTLPAIKSGERVEILKQDDGYAQVKLDDGTKGWVKQSYLVEEKPAIIQLAEVQEELDSLKSKHTDLLLEQSEPIKQEDSDLLNRIADAETQRETLQQRVNELESLNTEQLQKIQQLENAEESKNPRSRQILLWIVIPLLTLISGFFIGYKFIEARVKARFGGYNPL